MGRQNRRKQDERTWMRNPKNRGLVVNTKGVKELTLDEQNALLARMWGREDASADMLANEMDWTLERATRVLLSLQQKGLVQINVVS
jgi:hypothetical protein